MAENDNHQPATKGDLTAVSTELKSDIAKTESGLRGDLAKVESGLKAGIAAVKTELRLEIQETKKELHSEIHRVGLTLQSQIDRIEEKMTTLATKDDTSRIMNSIDRFAAEFISYRNRDVLRGDAIMKHDETLKEHETRLQKLETE